MMQRYATDQFFNGMALTPSVTQPSEITTQSTENNFGVFWDFEIMAGAWARMAIDLRGQTLGADEYQLSPNGLMASGAPVYASGVPVKLGCYELAFLPLSWYNPSPEPYPDSA
jgi:hypothetical protein